jgi:hypothetical protein
MDFTLYAHFGAVCLMGAIVLSSQMVTRRAQRERLRNEAHRLRCSLSVILRALRELHLGNLRSLDDNKLQLLPASQQIHLLRTQLSKLLSLEQAEVQAVMTACVALERVESVMSVTGKNAAGARMNLPRGADDSRMLQATMRQACTLIESAVNLMAVDLTCGEGAADEAARGISAVEVPAEADAQRLESVLP